MKTLRKEKRIIFTCMLVVLMSITLTGCQKLKETFGKEYRMIDNGFEQLEADISYSFEEYAEEEDLSEEECDELETYKEQLIADIRVVKSEMKNLLRSSDKLQEELEIDVTVEDYINKALVELRVGVKEILSEYPDGPITLKSTKVNRGILGSIWYFVRNNWLIIIIVYGFINYIVETIGEKLKENKTN